MRSHEFQIVLLFFDITISTLFIYVFNLFPSCCYFHLCLLPVVGPAKEPQPEYSTVMILGIVLGLPMVLLVFLLVFCKLHRYGEVLSPHQSKSQWMWLIWYYLWIHHCQTQLHNIQEYFGMKHLSHERYFVLTQTALWNHIFLGLYFQQFPNLIYESKVFWRKMTPSRWRFVMQSFKIATENQHHLLGHK